MSVISVKGLQGVAIYCSSLERSKAFYIDVLGCEFGDEIPGGLFLRAGDVTLYLEEGRKEQSDVEKMKTSDIYPCFAISGLKGAFEKLKQANVKIITEYVEYSPEFAMCRIADPDGNVLELAGGV